MLFKKGSKLQITSMTNISNKTYNTFYGINQGYVDDIMEEIELEVYSINHKTNFKNTPVGICIFNTTRCVVKEVD